MLAFLIAASFLGDPTSALRESARPERDRALVRLHSLGAASAAAQIAPLFDDPIPVARSNACIAAADLRATALAPKVRAALDDADPDVRSACATAAGELRDRAAVAILKRLSEHDAASSVRLDALRALIELGDAASRRALARRLGDPVLETRRDAIALLALMPQPWATTTLVRALTDWSPDLRIAAARGLANRADARGVEFLVRAGPLADAAWRAKIEAALESLSVSDETRREIFARPISPGVARALDIR